MASALAAITSSPVSITRHPLTPHLRHHAFHFSSVHHPQIAYPKLITCHAKFSGAFGYEANDINEAFFEGNDELMEDESDDEDDTESSIDLLLRFLGSMFKKVSRHARKASRSVLPDVISPQLVSFAVDGVLLLAALSVLKALLEVVCTLGGTVFVVILMLRVIWAAVAYFQSTDNGLNQNGTSYGRPQPV